MINDMPAPSPMVLVLSDATLRSKLAAELTAAGEDVVIVGDPADARLHPDWRDRGLLVIEAEALSTNEVDVERSGLHPGIWPGWLVVVGRPTTNVATGERSASVSGDNAAADIQLLLHDWRHRTAD